MPNCQRHDSLSNFSCADYKPYRNTCRDCGQVYCCNLPQEPWSQCPDCYHMDEFYAGLL